MKCDTAWNNEFIDQILSRHFRLNDLKKHRQTVLLKREKSLLPDTMSMAEHEQMRRESAEVIDQLIKDREELQEEINAINKHINNIRLSIHVSKPKEQYKNVFIKACPGDDCRGFLDSKFKCSLCDTKVCKDCHEIMEDEDEHECLPENIETAKLINSQCKPCPQCASLIYKLSGCNQIWCTQCKTAFDWTTGKIENTNIHNPHYFDWIRTNNAAPLEADCDGGIPNNWRIQEHLRKHKINYDYYNFVRAYNHVQMVEIPRYRVVDDNTDLRVNFILKDISEDELKVELFKRESKNNRMEAFRQLHQLLLDSMGDLLRKIVTLKAVKEFDALNEEFEAIRLYFNNNMVKIAERFNMKKARQLDAKWYII